jgi:hypothetical protein
MRGDEAVAGLRRVGQLVEQQVTPEGTYGGWSGHDVLVHLGAVTRLVGAFLRGAAEHRQPTPTELFSRELTPAEQAMTDLHQINQAVVDEFAHLSFDAARDQWRWLLHDALAQAARLSEEQWAAPGPDYAPQWRRPHLSEVVTRLAAHYDAHLTGQPH